MRHLLIPILALSVTALAAAQSATSPQFEVASVKRSPDRPTMSPVVGEIQPGGLWRTRDMPVYGLIRYAYPGHGLPFQIRGGPDWVLDDMFDIDARTPAGATTLDMQQMLRSLLAERFGLAVHLETREGAAYALVTRKGGKLGAGLKPPAVDCAAFRAGGERPSDPTRKPDGDRLACGSAIIPVPGPGSDWRLTTGDTPIAAIVSLLAGRLGRPVVDRTGLTQAFDVELRFSNATGPDDRESAPSLRTALAEQLGLELQDTRAPIEVVVIDRVTRPTEN